MPLILCVNCSLLHFLVRLWVFSWYLPHYVYFVTSAGSRPWDKGGGDHPDSYISGGGGLPKKFVPPFGLQFGLKKRGTRAPRAPPLDPPLLTNTAVFKTICKERDYFSKQVIYFDFCAVALVTFFHGLVIYLFEILLVIGRVKTWDVSLDLLVLKWRFDNRSRVTQELRLRPLS